MQLFGSVPNTSASLKQQQAQLAAARSRGLSGQLHDSYAASSDIPLRVSGPLGAGRSGLLLAETSHERSALVRRLLLSSCLSLFLLLHGSALPSFIFCIVMRVALSVLLDYA